RRVFLTQFKESFKNTNNYQNLTYQLALLEQIPFLEKKTFSKDQPLQLRDLLAKDSKLHSKILPKNEVIETMKARANIAGIELKPFERGIFGKSDFEELLIKLHQTTYKCYENVRIVQFDPKDLQGITVLKDGVFNGELEDSFVVQDL